MPVHSANSIRLRSILTDARIWGSADIRFSGVCTEAAQCQAGDLYIALTGPDLDGHDQVTDAISRGAVGVVVERPLPVDVPQFIVPDTRESLGHIAHEVAGHPSRKLDLIAVSGSVGTTSLSLLISSVLSAGGARAGWSASCGTTDGIDSMPQRATDSTLQLARWLQRLHGNRTTHAVVDVSWRDWAERRMAGSHVAAAVINSPVVPYPGMRREAGTSAWEQFAGQLNPNAPCILSATDKTGQQILRSFGCNVITAGENVTDDRSPDISAQVVEQHLGQQTILLSIGHETVAVETRAVGRAHLQHCLQAAAVGAVYGIDITRIAQGLSQLSSLPGCCEFVNNGQKYSIVLDGAWHPYEIRELLRTLRPLVAGRMIAVVNGLNLNGAERALLGRTMESLADTTVVTHGGYGGGCRPIVAQEIMDGCQSAADVREIPRRSAALLWALQNAADDDLIFIAGTRPTSGNSSAPPLQAHDRAVVDRILRAVTSTEPACGRQ